MRKLTALTAFAVFVTMVLAAPNMARAFGSQHVVIVYGQLGPGLTLTVELTSPIFEELPVACGEDSGLAGCISALYGELDCEISAAAPPFSDTDQGGLVYTLICGRDGYR